MRLLVHFHIYYLQHVDYFLDMMKNINSVRWDLFVTSPHIDEATENKIKEFKPDARIEHVPNEGYDIWPFIYVVKNICLEDYDYILKLHTKGPLPFAAHLNGMVFRDFMWRDALVEALIGSPETFRSNMDIFSEHSDVGMVFSDKLYIKAYFRTGPYKGTAKTGLPHMSQTILRGNYVHDKAAGAAVSHFGPCARGYVQQAS